MLATIGKVVPPASPLSVYASVTGRVPVNVESASGTSLALPGSEERSFTAAAAGGTPPYSFKWTRQNGVNKTVLESPSGATAYISWSGMIIEEYQSTTANCTVTDANHLQAISNVVVIGVTRKL